MTDASSSFVPDPSWPSILELATKLWGEVTDRTNPKDLRFGTKFSKSINPATNTWFDHEAGEGGGYREACIRALGAFPPPGTASPAPSKPNGAHPPPAGANGAQASPGARGQADRLKPWEHVGIAYDYRDADGVLIAQNVRMKPGFPQRFMQRRPSGKVLRDGEPVWQWSTKGLNIPLYRTPEMYQADPQAVHWLCEGEKDADRLAAAGLIATTNIAGAAHWNAERHNVDFAGRHVVILEDNDDAGRKRSARIAPGLIGVAASVKVLALPGLAPKGDVSDWLDAGGSIEELQRLAREQPEFVPEPAARTKSVSTSTEGVGRLRQGDNNCGAGEPPPGGDPESGLELPDDDIPPGDDDVDPVVLPDLFVLKADLPLVSRALRDRLAAHPWMFERGGPVRLVTYAPEENRLAEVPPFGVDGVVHVAHEVCRPYSVDHRGKQHNVTLPDRVAALYLALHGRWNLRPLHGICGSVLLTQDGGIHALEGYHAPSGLWCSRPPLLTVPERPFRDQAVDALYRLRTAMRTFTFKSSLLTRVAGLDADVVDIEQPPGLCESAALAGLLTAVCRASLPLAPGVMINAPSVSGSGAGKGLLARMIIAIAFGIIAKAGTAGHDEVELEKRIASALMRGEPALLLDNLNNMLLRSAQLESCLTEPLVSVRIFGKLEMRDVHCTAFVVVTGNGLQASADTARRFIYPTIEPPLDNPGERAYPPGFLDGIVARRAELLSDCLTIWRWGRQQPDLKRGLPFGSYERWAEWVRDPLLALGCADPIAGVQEARDRDPTRVNLSAMFTEWRLWHEGDWIKADDLNFNVRRLIDDRERTAAIRQKLSPLVNTRLGGFMLESQIVGNKANQVTEYRVVILPDTP